MNRLLTLSCDLNESSIAVLTTKSSFGIYRAWVASIYVGDNPGGDASKLTSGFDFFDEWLLRPLVQPTQGFVKRGIWDISGRVYTPK